MDSFTLDIGNNLTGLGFLYLIFKFILPIIIGIVLIGIAIIAGIFIFNRLSGSGLSRNEILLGIVGAGLIALLFIAR
jgi:hypothetical protein